MEHRPLILTDDSELLDDLLRIAAAAGVEIAHDIDPGARTAWRSAPLVLLDANLIPAALAAKVSTRPGVVAVHRAEPDATSLQLCLRLGVERTITIGEDDDVLIELLSGTLAGGSGDGHTIAVVSACGGAGASVFAAALAATAQRSGRGVVLADCDQWGSGLDVLLGIEAEGGIRWDELVAPSGRLPPDALHRALPSATLGNGQVAVLCHARTGGRDVSGDVVDVILQSGRRAGDLTVVDLPRHPTAAGDRVVERADLVVLVTTADVRGCFAAARVARRLMELGAAPELVVRGPSPGGIGADDIGATLGLPVVARMRPQPGLARDLENGRPPGSDTHGPLVKAATAVLARLQPDPS
jgi:secretion/DNA translocation related CpaE-like protein